MNSILEQAREIVSQGQETAPQGQETVLGDEPLQEGLRGDALRDAARSIADEAGIPNPDEQPAEGGEEPPEGGFESVQYNDQELAQYHGQIQQQGAAIQQQIAQIDAYLESRDFTRMATFAPERAEQEVAQYTAYKQQLEGQLGQLGQQAAQIEQHQFVNRAHQVEGELHELFDGNQAEFNEMVQAYMQDGTPTQAIMQALMAGYGPNLRDEWLKHKQKTAEYKEREFQNQVNPNGGRGNARALLNQARSGVAGNNNGAAKVLDNLLEQHGTYRNSRDAAKAAGEALRAAGINLGGRR